MMIELQTLFYKLIEPYKQTEENTVFRELHSFFFQQLTEIIEFSHRPQAKLAVQTLQKLYREFLLFTLYPNLKSKPLISVSGDYHQLLTRLELGWYQLQTPLFIQSGTEAVSGLNLFQVQQAFSYQELRAITHDFSHLLQHLYLQTPRLLNHSFAFLLPFNQEQFITTEYFLYFVTAENHQLCYSQIQALPTKTHFLVLEESIRSSAVHLPNVHILNNENFLSELATFEIQTNHTDFIQAFELQFSSYQHALELLMNYEQRQLTLVSTDLARMAKHQSQIKQLQQELNLWQTFYLRFHRLMNKLLGNENTDFPQLQPMLATTQVLQAFQKRTHRPSLITEHHVFETLLTIQPVPQRATPVLAEQFKQYLHTHWEIPVTIPFRKTLVPIEEGEV